MTLTDAAAAVVELLRANALPPDTEVPEEYIEFSWSRAAGVWMVLSQTNGEPLLEVFDQRGHGANVARVTVADALLDPRPLIVALRRVLG